MDGQHAHLGYADAKELETLAARVGVLESSSVGHASDANAHDGATPSGDSDAGPGDVGYGQRERPRSLPPFAADEAARFSRVHDLGGQTIRLGERYVQGGELWRNGEVVSTYEFPSLFRCYGIENFGFADLTISVPDAQWYNRDAVIDLRSGAREMLLHNVRLLGAPEHGVELGAASLVRGCDISADWVALAGGESGSLVQDSVFRQAKPLRAPERLPDGSYRYFDRAHHGAAKIAPAYDNVFERTDFLAVGGDGFAVGGVLWEDTGSGGNRYTDCLAGAVHAEIADNQGRGGPMYLDWCTLRGGAFPGYPVGLRQQGVLLMHLAPVVMTHGLIEVDLSRENGIILWDNDGRANAPSRSDSAAGPSLSSAGSLIAETLVRVRASDPASVPGRTVHLDHPERVELERVVFRLDASVPTEERGRLEALVAGRGNGCRVEIAG